MADSPPGTARYNTIHCKIRRIRGRAHNHPCVDCGGPACGWSHRHDTDQAEVANYDPRCKPCHFRYDGHWVAHQNGERNGQATLTENQVAEIRSRYAAGGIFQRELGLEYGITQQTVSKIIHRQRWT